MTILVKKNVYYWLLHIILLLFCRFSQISFQVWWFIQPGHLSWMNGFKQRFKALKFLGQLRFVLGLSFINYSILNENSWYAGQFLNDVSCLKLLNYFPLSGWYLYPIYLPSVLPSFGIDWVMLRLQSVSIFHSKYVTQASC